MAEPRDKDARKFYRMSRERWDDAQLLAGEGRTTGSVYMGGYTVEGALKALVVAQTPKAKCAEVLASFRGRVGHNFDWLRRRYADFGGAAPPKLVSTEFEVVDKWDTDLRYEPATIPKDEADRFLAAARVIWTWADGRL